MIFEFYPWKIDVDLPGTKAFYEKQDDSIDKKANQKFVDGLSEKQKYFFESLGVDTMKIEVDEKLYDIPKEEELPGGKIQRVTVNFLLCGKFLAIPEFQKELYSSEELFEGKIPESLNIVTMPEDEMLPSYDLDNLGCGIIFKPPWSSDDEKGIVGWDCGYIKGSILIMSDMEE